MTEFTEEDKEEVLDQVELMRDAAEELEKLSDDVEAYLKDPPDTIEVYQEDMTSMIEESGKMHMDKYDKPAMDKITEGETV